MKITNKYVLALGGFLAAWAGSNFDLNYRSMLWAVLAGVFGYLPKREDNK